MKLPTYEEFRREPEQLDVLEYPRDRSLFVAGPPGSGKTVLAVTRASDAARLHKQPAPLVTYNRMLRRLLSLIKDDPRVQPRTMHSFVYRHYTNATGREPPGTPQDPYDFRWSDMLKRMAEMERQPNLQHLVVDEAQSLPAGFFRYASRCCARTMSIFADEDQTLDDQRTTLEEIKNAVGLDDPMLLSRNHRNTPEIARLAEHFHSGRLPAAEVKRMPTGDRPRLIQCGLPETIERVSNWIRTRGGSIGIVVHANDTGRKLHQQLAEKLKSRRVNLYSHEQRNEDSVNMLEEGITILNAKSAKGQEFDAVFILELERFVPCRTATQKRVMYMLCTRARDMLFLIHHRQLSPAAAAALPGLDLLEP
ncbi:MAG: AAA family ATPase [Gammaproteobacteria bacterium]|nr:AAA family ATPase [Gammaproteobacteria bacterium]